MPNQPQTSPLISTKVLTLRSLLASKCQGTSEISMASDAFVCLLRRIDHWSQPVLHVVNVKTKDLVASHPLDLNDSISERAAQCRINATGQWIVIYDCSSVWFLEVMSKPTYMRLVCRTGPARIRLIKWTSPTTVTALMALDDDVDDDENDDFAYEFSVNEIDLVTEMVQHKRKKLPTVDGTIVDFSVLGGWSAISSVAFEQGKACGMLHLTDHETFFRTKGYSSSFCGVGSHGSFHDQQVIHTNVGSDQSLKVSASRFGSVKVDKHTTFQWTKTVRHVRTHDLSTFDPPIFLHISPEPGLIFIITSLSYVHVLLLADGEYLGCVRASTFPISGSVLCEDKLSVLLTDANCVVCKVSLDMLVWLQHFKRAESDILALLEPLRFMLRQKVPLTPQLMAELSCSLQETRGPADERFMELLSSLTPEELVQFFGCALQTHSTSASAVTAIRILAKHFSDRMPLPGLIDVFRLHCGDSGVFDFLNMLGSSNLLGDDLADYLQAAMYTGQYDALRHTCLVADTNGIATIIAALASNVHDDPQVPAILVQFCLRVDAIEALAQHCIDWDITQMLAECLPFLDTCDTSQKTRVWAALLSHYVTGEDLDHLLASQAASFFTADTLELFREHNRTDAWLTGAETWTTDLAADGDLLFLVINGCKDDQVTLAEFLRKLGRPRCEEIGRSLRDKQHTELALLVFKLGSCDCDYLPLAFGNRTSLDAAVYCLSRISLKLWLEALGEGVVYRDQLLRVLETAEFRAELLRHPFAAVRACVIVLLGDGLLELAHSIVEFLMTAVEFSDKKSNSFLQKSMITILTALNPIDSSKAVQFITAHHDFEHIKVLTDLLNQISFAPAKVVIAWLVKNPPTEEVDEEDLALLTSAVVASGERTAWTVIGHYQLQRCNVGAAMEAYLKSPHYDNHVEVWNAVKTAKDHWELALTYLDMVGLYVADPRVHAALTIVLAKTGRFDELERHLARPSTAAVDEEARTPNCRCCLDAPLEMNLLPCNHICACSGCAAKLENCPVCRTVIASKHRVFLP